MTRLLVSSLVALLTACAAPGALEAHDAPLLNEPAPTTGEDAAGEAEGSAPGPPASLASPSRTSPAVPPATPDLPLAVHYGFLQRTPIASSTNGAARDGDATARLIVPGMENVLVVTLAPDDPALSSFLGGGGKTAFRLSMVEVVDALATGADPVARELDRGHDYVAIDELEPSKAGGIRDGDPRAEAFARLLERHAGRVILYANSYNMAGSGENRFLGWTTALAACREHCRALASQVYLATTEAFIPGKPTATGCASGIACYRFLADAIEAAAPGIARRIVSVVDVRGTNLSARRADSFCAGAKGGALAVQMGVAARLGQRGIGTYALTYVANDVTGAAYRRAVDDFTACFVGSASRFAER